MVSLLFHRATIWIDLCSFLERNGRAIIQIGPLLVTHVLWQVELLLIERSHAQVDPDVFILRTAASIQQTVVRWWLGLTQLLADQLIWCIHHANHCRRSRLRRYYNIIKWFRALLFNCTCGTAFSVPKGKIILLIMEVRGIWDRFLAKHRLQWSMLWSHLWSGGFVTSVGA